MGHYLKMFRFVALFVLVAVAAAEPQWYGYAPAIDATHLKTANGDTVSVAAKKVEHHQLKAAEYAKKGYAFGYVKPAVVAATPIASYASPVVSYNGVFNPLYNAYAGVHAIGKREAEADSQWIYNAGVYANGYNGYTLPKVYNGVYNTAIASPVVSYNGAYTNGLYNTYGAGVHANGYNGYAIPKVYNGAYNTAIASPLVSYNGIYTNGLYNTYGAGVHAIGKREAEADSQWVYNNGYTPLTGYTGYNGLAGYTTPYAYGNVWNRAQYLW